MDSQIQQSNTFQQEKITDEIVVNLVGMAAGETEKLRRILKLSSSRKRSYVECHSDASNTAQIIITADPLTKGQDHQVIVNYGGNSANSFFNIKPPLMSIRVLRVLDGIALKRIVKPDLIIKPIELNNAPQVEKLISIPLEINQPEIKVEKVLSHRVLIVDDSVLIHKALELELNKASFDTQNNYAESGEACLKLINENQYDMIFLDIMMPGIDGFETCTEIRKMANYKKVPIIMLSAKTSPLDEVKGVMAGCTTYLTKPIKHEDFQRLLGRMDSWLKKYKTS